MIFFLVEFQLLGKAVHTAILAWWIYDLIKRNGELSIFKLIDIKHILDAIESLEKAVVRTATTWFQFSYKKHSEMLRTNLFSFFFYVSVFGLQMLVYDAFVDPRGTI